MVGSLIWFKVYSLVKGFWKVWVPLHSIDCLATPLQRKARSHYLAKLECRYSGPNPSPLYILHPGDELVACELKFRQPRTRMVSGSGHTCWFRLNGSRLKVCQKADGYRRAPYDSSLPSWHNLYYFPKTLSLIPEYAWSNMLRIPVPI